MHSLIHCDCQMHTHAVDHGTQNREVQYLASIFTGVVGGTVVLLAVIVILVIAERHKLNGKRVPVQLQGGDYM